MEAYQELPFREPALETVANHLLIDEPFPEVEKAPAWSRELTAASLLIVLLSVVGILHAIEVLFGSMVRYSSEVIGAYFSLGIALFFLLAAALMKLKRKAGWVLATLPLSFIVGVYTYASFFLLYKMVVLSLNFISVSEVVAIEFAVQLISIAGLSLLCSRNARAALLISTRTLAFCLLAGLLSGFGFLILVSF